MSEPAKLAHFDKKLEVMHGISLAPTLHFLPRQSQNLLSWGQACDDWRSFYCCRLRPHGKASFLCRATTLTFNHLWLLTATLIIHTTRCVVWLCWSSLGLAAHTKVVDSCLWLGQLDLNLNLVSLMLRCFRFFDCLRPITKRDLVLQRVHNWVQALLRHDWNLHRAHMLEF